MSGVIWINDIGGTGKIGFNSALRATGYMTLLVGEENMQRPIKFRAWDDYNKRMISEPFVIRTCKSGAVELQTPARLLRWDSLMQYTGLKDKNGVEIYEGDIAEKWCHCSLLERRHSLYNGGVGYYKSLITTVKWREQGLNYNIYPYHDDAYWLVIGNIYENPELLGE